jgi:non-heme chloroperoxidase
MTAAGIDALGRADIRNDLEGISLPTLVIHGDGVARSCHWLSGKRTAEMVDDAELAVLKAVPHGFNGSRADEINQQLLGFLPT